MFLDLRSSFCKLASKLTKTMSEMSVPRTTLKSGCSIKHGGRPTAIELERKRIANHLMLLFPKGNGSERLGKGKIKYFVRCDIRN